MRQDIEDENLEETLEDALTMNATSDFKRSRLHIDREMKRAGIMSLEGNSVFYLKILEGLSCFISILPLFKNKGTLDMIVFFLKKSF